MKPTHYLAAIGRGVIMASLVCVAPHLVAQTGNIALGSTVSTSSIENSSLIGSAAVDGSSSTRWASRYADDQWIEIDLGETYTLEGIVLDWEVAFAREYEIEVSVDGDEWQLVYDTNTSDGMIDDIDLNEINAQFIKNKLHTQGNAVGFLFMGNRSVWTAFYPS